MAHCVDAAPDESEFAVAAHVLTLLAPQPAGRSVSSVELSGSTNTDPVYVRRVLGPLREDGLVDSCPGRQGGWRLREAPQAIDLGRLWRLFSGGSGVVAIHAPNPGCAVGRSVTDRLFVVESEASRDVEVSLAKHTIAELAGKLGANR